MRQKSAMEKVSAEVRQRRSFEEGPFLKEEREIIEAINDALRIQRNIVLMEFAADRKEIRKLLDLSEETRELFNGLFQKPVTMNQEQELVNVISESTWLEARNDIENIQESIGRGEFEAAKSTLRELDLLMTTQLSTDLYESLISEGGIIEK